VTIAGEYAILGPFIKEEQIMMKHHLSFFDLTTCYKTLSRHGDSLERLMPLVP
jgi:hypothetical protein